MSKARVWFLLFISCLAFWAGVIYLIGRNAQWF